MMVQATQLEMMEPDDGCAGDDGNPIQPVMTQQVMVQQEMIQLEMVVMMLDEGDDDQMMGRCNRRRCNR